MGQYANQTKWSVDWTKLITGTPTYAAVGEIVNVDFGGITADALEDTVHGDEWRTYLAGLKNGGTISLTVRFGAGTHATLLDNVGAKSAHKIEFPLEVSTNTIPLSIAWDAIFTSLGIASPHDGLLEATVELTLSGAPTIVDEAAA